MKSVCLRALVALCSVIVFMQGAYSQIDEEVILMQPDPPRFPPNAVVPKANETGDNEIDALLGSSWSSSTITYSFYSDAEFGGDYYGSETVSEVAEITKTHYRNIFNRLNQLVGATFTEVTEASPSTYGQIRIMLSTAPSYAYAYYPGNGVGGDIHLAKSYDNDSSTNGWRRPPGNHGYMSMVHELGHALGLKHPHEGSPKLAAEDNTAWTVMSYNFKGNSAGTYMPFDIKALQYLYGTNDKYSGNTTYVSQSRIDLFSISGTYMLNDYSTYKYKQCLWDTGGIDTLDFSAAAAESSGYLFDLRPRGMLIANDEFHAGSDPTGDFFDWGCSIAENVIIENIVTSTSDDTIYLNDGDNTVSGYNSTTATGADVIYNASSSDTIDLSSYSSSVVTQTQDGNDLVLTLGSNGTITLKDYYLGGSNQPNIVTAGALPAFSVDDVSLAEGDSGTKTMTFTVSLSEANGSTCGVDCSTSNDTAIAGDDYVVASGSLSFSSTDTSKTFTVTINGDVDFESDETFTVTLSNPTGGPLLADSQGVGTITNDDSNDPPVASDDSYTISGDGVHSEAAPGLLSNDSDPDSSPSPLTATLVTGPSKGDVVTNADGSFVYAPDFGASGSDSFTYKANDGATDSPAATVSITINAAANTLVAADDFDSGNVSGGSGWGDDWAISGDAAVSTSETELEGSHHLRLRSATGVAVRTVDLRSTTSARLKFWWKGNSFESGETSTVEIYDGAWQTVLTVNDGDDDNAYHLADIDLSSYSMVADFQIRVKSNMSGTGDYFYIDYLCITGEANTSPGTITLPTSAADVQESDGSINVVVARSGGSTGEISVYYETITNTADTSDYTPISGTLTWADGNADDKSLTIDITDDSDEENDETFDVFLSSPGGGATIGNDTETITIKANDVVTNNAPVITDGPNADPATVTLPDGIALDVTATDADGDTLSYAWSKDSGPGTVSFSAQAASCTASFNAAGSYALRVTVSDGNGGSDTGTVSVIVNDAPTAGDGRIEVVGSGDLGGVYVDGDSRSAAFTINNTGTGVLLLTGNPLVAVSGTDAADFTVASDPAASIAAGASTTFEVMFDPSSESAKSATLTIESDDSSNGTVVIDLTGEALAGSDPGAAPSGGDSDSGCNTGFSGNIWTLLALLCVLFILSPGMHACSRIQNAS